MLKFVGKNLREKGYKRQFVKKELNPGTLLILEVTGLKWIQLYVSILTFY